jgi:hypothetical protein
LEKKEKKKKKFFIYFILTMLASVDKFFLRFLQLKFQQVFEALYIFSFFFIVAYFFVEHFIAKNNEPFEKRAHD